MDRPYWFCYSGEPSLVCQVSNLYVNGQRSYIYNSTEMELAYISIHKEVKRQMVVYPHTGILLSSKKELSLAYTKMWMHRNSIMPSQQRRP